MAKLYFRYGAMNCGKSTALIQVAHNYEERGMKVIVMKPSIDSKGSDTVVSRIGVSRKVDFLLSPEDSAYKIVLTMDKLPNCILVDEVQFMTARQIDQLSLITTRLDIPVICYGLRTDFIKMGFEGSERLLLLAHEIEELKTICICGKKSIFNARKVNGSFTQSGSQIAIDDSEEIEYVSLCATCYDDLVSVK